MRCSACGCTLTLKLTEQPEEREKRCWTIPADFRNRNDAKVAVLHLAFEQGAIEFLRFRGESPPEGYKVELPPPREPKKAKRKGADGAEHEGDAPKKAKLLSQAEQFLASSFPSKSAEPRASGSGSSGLSRARPSTSAAPIFLPRPGYIDPKPEPGELPAELPTYQPEPIPVNAPLRWETTQPSIDRTAHEYPPSRRTSEAPLSYNRSSEPDRLGSYGTRDHGRYQYELGDSRYDGPGSYGPDLYYAPLPAPHTEPWHARPPFPVYPEGEGEDVYQYYDADYERGYDYDYDYGFDYERDPYDAPPRPPPPPAPVPAGSGGRGYAEYERSGYDYDRGYARERIYSHTTHTRLPPPPPTLPPPPQLAQLTAGPISPPRIWVPAHPPPPSVPPPPSPPREWVPGPRAAKVDARRGGAGREPRRLLSGEPSELPPEPSISRVSDAVGDAGLVLESTLASASASASSSSTPGNTLSGSSKEELFGASTDSHRLSVHFHLSRKLITRSLFVLFFLLDRRCGVPLAELNETKIEYCNEHGYPRPQFFDALDDSGGAAAVRYKVWVVLGSERLELPTTYAGVYEGEEKMARKVLCHLRKRDMLEEV